MSHRRAFLKRLAALGAAAGAARIARASEAFAADIERLEAAGWREGSSGGQEPDWATLREEYLLDPDVVYLNHGSIGTIPRPVHAAHVAYLEACESNPWLHMWGDAWEEPREAVRRAAARTLGAAASDVALTHNTTEGFNILARGLPLGEGDEVLFSSLNHPGASVCWDHRARVAGFRVRRFEFPMRDVAGMSVRDVVAIHAREIREETRVLVFPHVDNMIGLRHPVRELTDAARARGVEFVAVDGAQTVGMIPVEAAANGVDFYAASPHKWLQAPKGLGLLYLRREVRDRVRPTRVTWGQERWAGTIRVFEDYGTRNLPELLALGDAVEFQERLGAGAKAARYRDVWEGWREATEATPGVRWRSPDRWELSASLFALETEGMAAPDLFRRLWSVEEGGFVFRAFGDPLNTARVSPNVASTAGERTRFLAAIREVVAGP